MMKEAEPKGAADQAAFNCGPGAIAATGMAAAMNELGRAATAAEL